MVKKFLLFIPTLFFSIHLFSSDEAPLDVHVRTPQQFAILAKQNAQNAQALKERYQKYLADKQSTQVVTACDCVESAMCRLWNVASVDEIPNIESGTAALSGEALKVFQDKDVHALVDLTEGKLEDMLGASDAVLNNMDLWPKWQLERAAKVWAKDSGWPRLMGGFGRFLAGAGYLVRLPLPRKGRMVADAAKGATVAGSAYVATQVVTNRTTPSVHVHVSSRSSSSDGPSVSVNTSSRVNLQQAGKAAAVLGLLGVGIGAGKIGWALWNGSTERQKLSDAVNVLTQQHLMTATIIRLIQAQYGIDALRNGQGVLRGDIATVGGRVDAVHGAVTHEQTGLAALHEAVTDRTTGLAALHRGLRSLREELTDAETGRLVVLERKVGAVGRSVVQVTADVGTLNEAVGRLETAVTGEGGLAEKFEDLPGLVESLREQVEAAQKAHEERQDAILLQVKGVQAQLATVEATFGQGMEDIPGIVESVLKRFSFANRDDMQRAIAGIHRRFTELNRRAEIAIAINYATFKMQANTLMNQLSDKPTLDLEGATARLFQHAITSGSRVVESLPPFMTGDDMDPTMMMPACMGGFVVPGTVASCWTTGLMGGSTLTLEDAVAGEKPKDGSTGE